MSKKKIILLVILGILVIIVATVIFLLKQVQKSFDQVNLQYDSEVISTLKRPLDYSSYKDGLAQITPDRMQELDTYVYEKTINQIQQSIRDGQLTCEEVLLYYVQRIQDMDDNYNSVIQLNANALKAARSLDTKLTNGEDIGSLFGTIVLIKDNIADKDMNTASGAYALRDLTTTRDSFIVHRLKSEDAIILGKANLSEWSNFMSMPSSSGFSVLGGQTKNAYGKYDVGGSSSGSSVAASLNLSTITLGSETAGSLIYPAGQNSVVALKPTIGLLSRDLIVPISEAQDTAGIIARSVQDVLLSFRVAAAKDPNDPLSKHMDQFDMESLNSALDIDFLKGKRLGMIKEDSDRYATMKKELEALGAEIIDVVIDESLEIDMMSILNYGIVVDVDAFLNNEAVVTSYKSLEEILAYNKEDAKVRMPYGAKLHEDAIENPVDHDTYTTILNKNITNASKAIDDVLKEHNITAIVSFSNDLSGIYAVAMYPALTVPAGYKDNGEPYGVTFVGTLNDDVNLLNIGYSYEQGTQHRKAPVIK